MTLRLKGKGAIITGAGSGIGLSTAVLFAQHGVKLLILLDIASMDKTLKEIQKVASKCNVFDKTCGLIAYYSAYVLAF